VRDAPLAAESHGLRAARIAIEQSRPAGLRALSCPDCPASAGSARRRLTV